MSGHHSWTLAILVPGEGLEPPTNGLQNRCSTAELTRRIGSVFNRLEFLVNLTKTRLCVHVATASRSAAVAHPKSERQRGGPHDGEGSRAL